MSLPRPTVPETARQCRLGPSWTSQLGGPSCRSPSRAGARPAPGLFAGKTKACVIWVLLRCGPETPGDHCGNFPSWDPLPLPVLLRSGPSATAAFCPAPQVRSANLRHYRDPPPMPGLPFREPHRTPDFPWLCQCTCRGLHARPLSQTMQASPGSLACPLPQLSTWGPQVQSSPLNPPFVLDSLLKSLLRFFLPGLLFEVGVGYLSHGTGWGHGVGGVGGSFPCLPA